MYVCMYVYILDIILVSILEVCKQAKGILKKISNLVIFIATGTYSVYEALDQHKSREFGWPCS